MIYQPDVNDIDDELDTHLTTEVWIEASDDTKTKAVATANRIINRLNLDTNILDNTIIEAVSEIVLVLLDGIDMNDEQDSLNVTSRSYASTKTSYDRNLALEHHRAGVPSSVAWDILKPWLIPNDTINFNRVG